MSHSATTSNRTKALTNRSTAVRLAVPEPGRAAAEAFVAAALAGMYDEDLPVVGSDRFRGGQSAADSALAGLQIDGYAAGRNEVFPQPSRTATALSPYIRHGLLTLPEVWDLVRSVPPSRDSSKLADQLLWQEYSRHWYARMGLGDQAESALGSGPRCPTGGSVAAGRARPRHGLPRAHPRRARR